MGSSPASQSIGISSFVVIYGCGKLIGKFNVSVEGKRRKGKGKEKEIEGRGKERNYFL